jgi:hypothetical protein
MHYIASTCSRSARPLVFAPDLCRLVEHTLINEPLAHHLIVFPHLTGNLTVGAISMAIVRQERAPERRASREKWR